MIEGIVTAILLGRVVYNAVKKSHKEAIYETVIFIITVALMAYAGFYEGWL